MMDMTAARRFILVVAVLLLFVNSAWGRAPTDQLKESIDKAVKILENPTLKRAAMVEVRRVAIRYDVSIEGVSLISTYRTQFNRIIETSSYQELVKKMEAKLEELSFKDQAKARNVTKNRWSDKASRAGEGQATPHGSARDRPRQPAVLDPP